MSLEQLAQPMFVDGVDDGPEQTDADGIDVPLTDPIDQRDGSGLVQGLVHGSVSQNAFGNLEGETAWHERLGKRYRIVEGVDTPTLAQQQHVGMTLGGEECGTTGATGEHGIGRPGGGVNKQLAAAKQCFAIDASLLRCQRQHLEHAEHRVIGSGRRLVQPEAVLVFEDEIREGAAGVYRKPHTLPSGGSGEVGWLDVSWPRQRSALLN